MSPTPLIHVRVAWAFFFTFGSLVTTVHSSEQTFLTAVSTNSVELNHVPETSSAPLVENATFYRPWTNASSPTSPGVPRKAKTWAELNQSCHLLLRSDVMQGNQTLWEAVDGPAAFVRFQEFYQNNRIMSTACPECFEQKKEDCKSDNPECDGLRDDINEDKADAVRWDTALGLYLNVRNDLNCDSGGEKCQIPDCQEDHFESPGDFLLLKATAQISAMLHDIWEGLENARDSTSDSAEQLEALFLPPKDTSQIDLGMAIGMAIASAVLNIAFAGMGTTLSAGADIAEKSAKLAWEQAARAVNLVGTHFSAHFGIFRAGVTTHYAEATKKEDIDAQAPLGRVADNLQKSIAMTTTTLFGTGQLSGISIAGLALSTLFAAWNNQSALIGHHVQARYSDIYVRSLIHQFGVQIWELDFADSHVHKEPVIYFANGDCANVHENVPPGAYWKGEGDIEEHRIDYDGKCWWLIGAGTTGGFQEAFCDQALPLPGTSEKQLEQFPLVVPTNLSDFIVPSIETWKGNNHTNLFQDGLWTSNFNSSLDSRWPSGLGAIPICDYFGNASYPGRGCPAFGQKGFSSWTNDDNKQLIYCNVYSEEQPDSSNRFVTPGFFVPGECRVQVWHFKGLSRQLEGNFYGAETNAYEVDQIGVSIKDSLDAEIGNSGTAAIGNKTLRVWNSALPEELLMHVSPGDEGVMEFWYGSQYWTSDSGDCRTFTDTATFAGREVLCRFRCDKSPVSGVNAIHEHPLPKLSDNTTQQPFSGIPVNVIMNTATAHRPEPTPENRVAPSYKPGTCHIHVTSWDREEYIQQPNELDEIMLQARLKDGDGNWIGIEHNALQVARWKSPLAIYGLKGNLTMEILWDDDDYSPLGFVYTHDGKTERWESNVSEGQYGKCEDVNRGDYRTIHCDFECE